ncbi:hypothetical protein GY21_15715 [Cryobacterium roopkundense]|uniref:Uncharacterized protein n=1 Tax=Cryobacterium roopkundense TaxID=1001240 RepID=A0A099J1S4_9MICO|nr:hypothetical protein [Cryobacterium roopkundense]KGJ72379.1 hypothetical protein GY21_15715 [Cryobacterium roopkundense]MBB5642347.1 hypothetical protein [Cryobacterium roopkundense]
MADVSYDNDYERAQVDPIFRERMRTAYVGSWDVLDALWWEAQPEETSPAGIPSPLARQKELQRRIFAADGDAAHDTASRTLLRQLDDEIRAERAALLKARTGERPAAEPDSAAFAVASVADGAAQAASPLPGTPAAERPAPRRVRWFVAAGLVAALAVGGSRGQPAHRAPIG